MNTRLLTILILLCSFGIGANDPVNFPETTEEFLQELSDYMSDSKQEVCILAFKEFEQKCRAGHYSEEKLMQVRNLCNSMLNLKMAAKPYFSDYLQALCAMDDDTHPAKLFVEWHQVLQTMLQKVQGRRFVDYKKFLAFSFNFFQTQLLKDAKSGIQWQVKGSNYGMEIKDNKAGLVCETVRLVASRKADSIAIENTSGIFLPSDNHWLGKGGTIHWPQQDMREVYATLDAYQLDIKKGFYKAENATLYHPQLFEGKPVAGKLEDKLVMARKGKEKSYPRFETAKKNIKMDNLISNVLVTGGVQLQGNTMNIYGTATQKATIDILDANQKVVARAFAKEFFIHGQEKVTGKACRVVLFTEAQDSIMHPAVQLHYYVKDNMLQLKREKQGSGPTPFYASYLNFNVDADKINWYLNQDSIVFNQKKASIGAGNYKVKFESPEYFDVQTYRKMQNVADYNPIATLRNLSEELGSTRCTALQFAQKLNPRFDVSSIKGLIYDLAAKGFLYYEPDLEQIDITDKTIHYAHASQGKRDFDNIRIVSDTETSNAVVHLPHRKTLANGVKIMEFSSARKVAARPTNKQVLLMKDRNISFDGRLFAGLASMEGRDFNFNYNDFNLQLDSIRYFDFFLPTGQLDKRGEPIALSLASRLEHLNGILLIDAPANKSGREDIGLFPAFNSKGNAHVYYDAEGIQKGCYNRDSFYFELKPFIFNNLSSYTADRLHFDGQLISADIFPPIKETVRVQEEDQSLGFTTETGEDGLPLYAQKGNFNGSIHLSNQGLLGKGKVNYMWASIESDDIIFKPKQMLSSARQFELSEQSIGGVDVPKVSGEEVEINWRPYQDSMYIRATQKSFNLYSQGNYTLHDILILTPDGLKGRGIFEWEEGVANANVFSIGNYSIASDTTDVSIKVKDLEELALNTKNVYAKLDFENKMGAVKANVDTVTTLLPYNAYRTSMNEYNWNMEEETIQFLSDEQKLGHFNSTAKALKGLKFDGKTALYNLKTNELHIGGVPRIIAADAFIIPADGAVEIHPGGQMSTLNNAQIIADTSNQYHVINRATVDIKDRETYKASGWYVYNIGKHEQEIKFDAINGQLFGKRQKKRLLTKAEGSVTTDDNFYIDHKTQFSGTIRLESDQQNLHFDGFARLDASALTEKHWFSIKSKGDKKDLHLSYNKPKNMKGETLHNGLYISKLDGTIYPSVMAPLHMVKDREIFGAQGVFNYNERRDHFLFGDSLKIVSGRRNGNLLQLDNTKEALLAEGKFAIGSSLPYVEMTVAGQALKSLKSDKTKQLAAKFDVLAGLDLNIPEKVLKVMQADIVSASFDARLVDYYHDAEFFEKALSEFIPDEEALEAMLAKMIKVSLDIPDKYDHYNLFFSRIPFIWNAELQSFVSAGDQLALASIQKAPVNRWINGYMEVRSLPSGSERLYCYLKSPSDYYYYFEYREGILSMISNNEKFNEAVAGLNKRERSKKMKDGELFEIQAADQARAQQFIQRIKNSRG